MKECKIVSITTNMAAQKKEITKVGGLKKFYTVSEHPALEEELNRYLAQGYYIVNMVRDGTMDTYFVLEREV